MTRGEEIVRKAMNSYPDCPERGFGTGDYEYPEFQDDKREAFICGAEWADKHPNPNTIKTIFKFALEKTNFLIADNLESIDWEVLIKKAMK